jgi:hypothetical protein
MKHPAESVLALFAGGDLGRVTGWRVRNHVNGCDGCRAAVNSYRSLRSEVSWLGELPANLDWNRLASEMNANIRLGLAAGECVGGPPDSDRRAGRAAFAGWQTLLAYAGLIAVVVAGVWLQRPASKAVRSAPAALESGGAVVGVSGDGIQVTEGGRGLGLRYGAFRDVNYSADASGAMGARYVDTSTGYVTVVNVNVE